VDLSRFSPAELLHSKRRRGDNFQAICPAHGPGSEYSAGRLSCTLALGPCLYFSCCTDSYGETRPTYRCISRRPFRPSLWKRERAYGDFGYFSFLSPRITGISSPGQKTRFPRQRWQ
jgi:hypothetical protein